MNIVLSHPRLVCLMHCTKSSQRKEEDQDVFEETSLHVDTETLVYQTYRHDWQYNKLLSVLELKGTLRK